jgi:hypothetical protein
MSSAYQRDNVLIINEVDARNRIEKEGDLETHSYVRAEIVAPYLDVGPRIEVPASLFQNPAALLRTIPTGALGKHVRRNGALRLERRWVENTLPDYELLDALLLHTASSPTWFMTRIARSDYLRRKQFTTTLAKATTSLLWDGACRA